MKNGVDHIGISVVYCCHDGKGKILLAKRTDSCRDEHNRWDIGGGGVDFGETIEAALRREIKEEYNAEVLKFEFLGYRDVFREVDGVKTHWLPLDFKVLIDPATVHNNEPDKHSELRWSTKDTLPDPLHSQLPFFLEKYADKIWTNNQD
ncbi:MAG: NUDIX domain-containing protein [Weeksellaceae bacterium]